MCVCVTVMRKEEEEEKEEEEKAEERMIKEYHKEIVEEVEIEGNRNDMKCSHYDTSSNDGVESSIH